MDDECEGEALGTCLQMIHEFPHRKGINCIEWKQCEGEVLDTDDDCPCYEVFMDEACCCLCHEVKQSHFGLLEMLMLIKQQG